MTALASLEIELLITDAIRFLPERPVTYLASPLVVCPERCSVLTYAGTSVRNALHCAALQYAGQLWDLTQTDAAMVQFLLEFRAWINTPGREVMIP